MQSDGQTADAVTQTATDTLAEFKGHCIAYSLQGNINAYISGEKLVWIYYRVKAWGQIFETFLRHFPKIFLCQMI